MNSILLFRDDEKAIDKDHFLKILASIKGVSDITVDAVRANPYLPPIHCNYSAEGDTVLIELATDSRAIYISDFGPASYDFAVQLQARFDEPLRIIDESYNFDLQLRDYQTAYELEAGIDAAYREEAEDDE